VSRRKKAEKRPVPPDPRYDSQTVSKFINRLMEEGKKSTAERIFYDSMDMIEQRTGQPGVQVFKQALSNVKPVVEVKSRRVGGATYQVPVEWGAGDAVDRRVHARPERAVYGGAVGGRVDRRQQGRGQFGQEERRHTPDGGGEQGVRPLPVVG
jgi:hypothetical protein